MEMETLFFYFEIQKYHDLTGQFDPRIQQKWQLLFETATLSTI